METPYFCIDREQQLMRESSILTERGMDVCPAMWSVWKNATIELGVANGWTAERLKAADRRRLGG